MFLPVSFSVPLPVLNGKPVNRISEGISKVRFYKVFTLSAACLFVCLTAGCDSRPLPEGTTGTVEGRVTIEGEPAPEGTVVLMSHTKDGHAATGTVKSDGYFSMRFRDGTKLMTGIYAVGVTPPGASAAGGETMDVNSAAYQQMMMQGEEGEGAKPPFAERYLSPTTSGKEFEVSEGSNELNLDLKKT